MTASYKKVQKMLYDYPIKKKQIGVDEISLEEMKLYSKDISALRYDGVKVNNSSVSDETAQEAIKNAEREGFLKHRINVNKLFIKKIDKAMEVLTRTERDIITQKYFLSMRDYEVYYGLCISRANYYRIKKEAVEKIDHRYVFINRPHNIKINMDIFYIPFQIILS